MRANFVGMRIFRIQNIYRLIKWMYRMKKSAQIWERVSKGEKESKRARKSARNSDREKAREREKEIKSKLNAMKIKKWETATITVDGNTFNALVAELIYFFFYYNRISSVPLRCIFWFFFLTLFTHCLQSSFTFVYIIRCWEKNVRYTSS